MIDALRRIYGEKNVIGTDIKKISENFKPSGLYEYLDVLDKNLFEQIVEDYDIDWIIHNASILSAKGERDPHLAMKVNTRGFEIAIEIARINELRILAPSSIAAFGPSTPQINTPDITIMRPNTMYGITKVWVELLGNYYNQKWNVDFRSLRYPGIISYKTPPGGGTTDYAVEIYYEALKNTSYTCFLKEDSLLPMMYMPDCIRGTIELLQITADNLKQRVYNISAMSFSPKDLASEIMRFIPDFKIEYAPDHRQTIANSWPNSIDDSAARDEWGWMHEFDIKSMTKDMLEKLSIKLQLNL